MRFTAGNAQHIGARSQQQDAFGFSNPGNGAFAEHAGLLGVVADGMGGMARGREASRAAVRSFLQAYQGKSPSEQVPQALIRSLTEANRSVLSLGGSGSQENGVGTTLVAAVVHRNALHWISAGDSRVYLLRNNQLTRVTMDHVYARRLNEQVAQGEISRAEAVQHPERLALTSYLGIPELLEIDRSVRPLPLEAGDCVILCTDGLYRALSEQEIAAAFHDDLNGACDTLIRRALEKRRPEQDNLTVIALSNEPDSAKFLGLARRRSSRKLWMPALAAGVLLALLGGVGVHIVSTTIHKSAENPPSPSAAPYPTPRSPVKNDGPTALKPKVNLGSAALKMTPSKPRNGDASYVGTSVSAKEARHANKEKQTDPSSPKNGNPPVATERPADSKDKLDTQPNKQQSSPPVPPLPNPPEAGSPKPGAAPSAQSGGAMPQREHAGEAKETGEHDSSAPATDTDLSIQQPDGARNDQQSTKRPDPKDKKNKPKWWQWRPWKKSNAEGQHQLGTICLFLVSGIGERLSRRNPE